MRLPTTIVVTIALTATPAPGQRFDDESPAPYEIVVAAAVPVLPPPLRTFFEGHLETIRENVTGALCTACKYEPGSAGTACHHVMMDVAADRPEAASRHLAARDFPRDRTAAMALYRRHGREDGGTLPWELCDRRAGLERAFRDGDVDTILREAAALLHFATDAALPFNTTADREGFQSECLQWSKGRSISGASLQHRSVRYRYQVAFAARLRDRFAYEVRVAPQRYSASCDCIGDVFDALLEAHEALDDLEAIDVESTRTLGIFDADSFDARVDQYYRKLAEHAAPVLESRLEAAALLGANLIGAAWAGAGGPSPSQWDSGAAPKETRADLTGEVQKPYVGSRGSTVFHRTTCRHVGRIKPHNRVYFSTAKQAREAGRKPCKSCRPDVP